MKKLLAVLMAVAMLTMFAACSSSGDDASSGDNKKVLKVGTSADFPPFEFHKDIDGVDTIVGIDINLAQYIADSLGYELEIVDMSYDALLGTLNEGDLDLVIAGLTIREERNCEFSIPYYEAEQVLITTADFAATVSSTDDFMGKKIIGQLGSTQEGLANQYAGDTAIIVPNVQDGVMMVQQGAADGIIVEDKVGETAVAANSDLVLADVYIEAGENKVGVAAKKGDTAMIDLINPILEEVKEQELIDKWFAEFETEE